MGKWGVKLEISLPALARQTISDKRLLSSITPLFSDFGFKQEFGKRIVDEIVKRTESGIDKKDNAFKPGYSTIYKKSTIFKIFKGAKRTVDLHLTGEMLADLDVIKVNRNSIVLGFPSTEQEAKAHGHINGGNNLPVRDFFGLPISEQSKILTETIKDFASSKTNFDFGNQSAASVIEDELFD